MFVQRNNDLWVTTSDEFSFWLEQEAETEEFVTKIKRQKTPGVQNCFYSPLKDNAAIIQLSGELKEVATLVVHFVQRFNSVRVRDSVFLFSLSKQTFAASYSS